MWAISIHHTIINSSTALLDCTAVSKVHFFFKSTAQQNFLATALFLVQKFAVCWILSKFSDKFGGFALAVLEVLDKK